MRGHLPLHQVIDRWPTWAPDTLTELADSDPDELKALIELHDPDDTVRDLLWQLRGEVLRDRKSGSKLPPIRSIETVSVYLENNWIRPRAHQWLFIALDSDRNRVIKPRFWKEDGRWVHSVRILAKYYETVPDAADLEELPPGGAWLVVYGQGPNVLTSGEVRARLRALLDGVPVVDVVFNHLGRNTGRTLYSLRDQVGATYGPAGWQEVEFPHHLDSEEEPLCW